MKTVLRNARILAGDEFRDDLAVVIEDGRINALVSDAAPQLGSADEQVDLGGGWLLPGFIDAQVNGGGGVLFNNTPDVDSLRTLAAAHASCAASQVGRVLLDPAAGQLGGRVPP